MAYVPPALRKKAQAPSTDGPPGTTAEAAGSSRGNLPPGSMAAAEPLFSQGDIVSHYWGPQDERERPGRGAEGHHAQRVRAGARQAESRLHILPGGERFRGEQLGDAAGAQPAGEPVSTGWESEDRTRESGGLTERAGALADEVPRGKSPAKETQASDESQNPTEENLGKDKQEHGRSTGPSEDGVKKQRPTNNDKTKNNKDPNQEPEPPYSPDLTLYPLDPIAVFEQAQGTGPYGANTTARFRFAGYHRIASLEYLAPHSRELVRLLEQKWTTTDRRGRARQAQRPAGSWMGSLRHRWAVVQMERDHGADGRLAPPRIEVGDASAGKSVRELLAEMRLGG